MNIYSLVKKTVCFLATVFLSTGIVCAQKTKDGKEVEAEHGMIGNTVYIPNGDHKIYPGTEWFPNAGLGLFIHWGINSVKNLDISWPMIPGRELDKQNLSKEEIAELIKTKNWNKYNNRPNLTPNNYWAMAKDFNPEHFNPDKWIKAAKEAGFKYAVFVTRHHDGFAMWPSAYGDFNTKNYAGGKDYVKMYVDACRKYGLKVGLYYSPPDFHFDRDYMNFMYYKASNSNHNLPKLDADLNPRKVFKTKEELAVHQKAMIAYERGQLHELLTNYGKIDILWFDGTAPVPNARNLMTQTEIRTLQPGIVINPRMHGTGDFVSFERNMPTQRPQGWGEFCNTWTNSWTNSTTLPFRSNAFVIGQFATCRSMGINYLLGIGPDAQGVMSPNVYKNMKEVADWMKTNHEAVQNVLPSIATEKANVPVTVKGNTRYLFAIPEFAKGGSYPQDMLPIEGVTLKIQLSKNPKAVKLLGGKSLQWKYTNGELSIDLPKDKRSKLVDVVKVVE